MCSKLTVHWNVVATFVSRSGVRAVAQARGALFFKEPCLQFYPNSP